jgi:hypothetical protein
LAFYSPPQGGLLFGRSNPAAAVRKTRRDPLFATHRQDGAEHLSA